MEKPVFWEVRFQVGGLWRMEPAEDGKLERRMVGGRWRTLNGWAATMSEGDAAWRLAANCAMLDAGQRDGELDYARVIQPTIQ